MVGVKAIRVTHDDLFPHSAPTESFVGYHEIGCSMTFDIGVKSL